MRWSKSRRLAEPVSGWLSQGRSTPAAMPLLAVTIAIVLASALLLYSSPEEKRISIYSNAANYSLPVLDRNGDEYIGLLELFEPLGAVSAKANGNRWRFRYYDVESEFTTGQNRARIHGSDFDLPANFLLENGRGLVPLSCLGTLMPRILGGPVTFNQNSRRLFVGNVAVHFTAQVSKTTPPKLVMNFTAPVNPMIATGPGQLRMTFNHEAVVAPGSQALTFDSKVIPSASFQENNGSAALLVSATVPLMASFANNGRTVIVEPVLQFAGQVQSPPSVPRPPNTVAPPIVAGAPATRRYFAVIDPSHGGDERGASLSAQLAEKDVTLAFGRRLRQELETRGLATLLLRDSDSTMSLDQRATLTNSAHAAIYICLHAASQGEGVGVYTALVPTDVENRGPFFSWDAAQAAFQLLSQSAGNGLVAELQNKHIRARSLVTALRPLNNITTAALAVEVSPPSDDISELNSPAYQQYIAGAIATGLVDIRDKLELQQ